MYEIYVLHELSFNHNVTKAIICQSITNSSTLQTYYKTSSLLERTHQADGL